MTGVERNAVEAGWLQVGVQMVNPVGSYKHQQSGTPYKKKKV